MDVDARVEALEAENQRLRDELERLREVRGMKYLAPIEFRLTPKESVVLGRLLRGGLVSREALMAALYRDDGAIDEPEIKIVDVFVCKLRKKLKPYGVTINTRWGQGYEILPDVRARYRAEWEQAALEAAS